MQSWPGLALDWGAGNPIVKPEQRDTQRHKNRNEGGQEGQGERSPRDEESGGKREARRVAGPESEEKKAKPDVRTTNANCCT